MAELAAVENLKQVQLQLAHQIPDAKNQVESLEKRLQPQREDEAVRELFRRLRLALYDAEDIIDTYVTGPNDRNFFNQPIHALPQILNEVEAAVKKLRDIYRRKSTTEIECTPIEVEDKSQLPQPNDCNFFNQQPQTLDEIEAAVKKLRDIYGHMSTTEIECTPIEVEDKSQKPRIRQSLVGFEDEILSLKGCLLADTPGLDVISIVGMPGLGKTTLAYKLFCDPDIRLEFPTRIWVHVSQVFPWKDIFLSIVEEFTILTEDIKSKTEQMLAELVVGYLENERFLLVMDDVWLCEHWDRLQIALPESNAKGRVLITSRQHDVCKHASRYQDPYTLRFLNLEESVMLLKLAVFGDKEFPIELEYLGRQIAGECRGIALLILIIAGILITEVPSDMTARKKIWEDVYQRLANNDGLSLMEDIALLGYEKMPYHLKECFLYFGMFPEDFEIPAKKLIHLWIAEGLISQQGCGCANLEKTAENYLEQLIIRNLVVADKLTVDGKVKTCRIHDMLRYFCLDKSENEREGFCQEIKRSRNGEFQPPVSAGSKFHRLCIHSDVLNFASMKPNCPSVRTLISSSRVEATMPIEDISAIPKGFQRLRVLDVEPIKFMHKLPRDIFQLYGLRYLVLSVNLQVLPWAFSKLWNIQTLVFGTTSRTLDIRADLLNMIHLRYFKTNASAALPTTSESSEGSCKGVHTLGALSPESCTKDVFERVPNLKKLGVRGKLALLLDGKNQSLVSLSNLEKLKLLNDVFPVPPTGAELSGLPPASKFPPRLKFLTLSRTSLDWSNISILGSLECLKVLKLKDKAFVGDEWVVIDGGFLHLEVLHIERTNLKTWLASDHHFPKLQHLILKHCDYLEGVPMELADVPSFVYLDLFHCKLAAASALQIEEKIKQDNRLSDNHGRQFDLSISPMRNAKADD